jgi:cell division protein FtsN
MSADKGKVVAGVFIGMVLGIAAAGGVAWYVLNKKPTSFTNKEPVKPAPQNAQVPASAPVVTVPATASGVAEPKQHFEFYKELTDKPDGAGRRNNSKPAPKPKELAVVKPQPTPPVVVSKDLYFVQAGSFQNVGDAEKLKAKLAFSGFEANIQDANIPDKGVWHRVRLGPFNDSEAAKTISALRQNGIIATQLRAQ